MAPVNLLELNPDEFKVFLDSFDYVFSDCDGVIWTSKTPIPGSGDFFKIMKEHGKSVSYVSNNSFRIRESYEMLFQAAGIKNGLENLIIPSIAIAEYLKSLNFSKKAYCVACSETIKILESYGIKCEHGPDIVPDVYNDFLKYLEDDEEIGAVVFDSDFKVNLPKLYKAKTHLMRPDVLFINGASDRYMPLKIGSLDLGPEVFTELVVEQVKRKPVPLGKPGREFGEFVMKRAGVKDPSRVLFIGDMIDQDVRLGKEMGFKTMLVLTNILEDAMMAHAVKPDYYAPSLGSLVSKL